MIAIIPARGGSVRIHRKNIKLFFGRPIIAYAIETARNSGLFDDVIVSADDDLVVQVAMDHGASVYRRATTDDGARGTQDVARDVLMSIKSQDACVIYPTSPLLKVDDLHRGYALLQRSGTLFTMSVNVEPLFDAGCFYFGVGDAFRNRSPLIDAHTAMVPMPVNRVCDINTPEDWERAERLYLEMRGRDE